MGVGPCCFRFVSLRSSRRVLDAMPACMHFFFHSVSSWHALFMFMHVLAILPRSFSSSIPSTRSSSSWGSWFGSLFSSVVLPSLGIVFPHVHHILVSLPSASSFVCLRFLLLLLARVASHASGCALLLVLLSSPRYPSSPKRGAFASVLPTKESSKHLPPLFHVPNELGRMDQNEPHPPSVPLSPTHTKRHSLIHEDDDGGWRMADGGWRGRFTVGCVAGPRGCGGRCTARRGEGVARVDPRTRETKGRLPRTPSSLVRPNHPRANHRLA